MAGIGDQFNKAKSEAQELQIELAAIADAISSIGDTLKKDFIAELEKVGDLTKEQKNNLAGSYSKGFKEASKAVESVAVALAKQKAGTLKLSEIQKLQNKLIEIKAKKQLVLNQAELYGVELSEEKLKALNDEIDALEEGVGKIKDAQTPLGSLAALATEKFKILQLSIKDIGAAVFTYMVKMLKEVDTEVVDIQRNFAVTKGEALDLNQTLARTALEANTLGVNLESVTKAVNTLNTGLGGTAFIFTKEIRNDVAYLQERLKLSDEAALGLSKTAFITGKAVSEVREEQEGVLKAVKSSTGVSLNFRQTLEEANKIGGALRLNMDALPGGIVKAVAQAKSLGMELDQIKGIQSSILDFESSIAAELEAEALTNRELNLEKARTAALNNDIVGLTQEIASQFGSITEFQNLNYVQQEAFARAAGLSSDQLADILMTSESINANLQTGVETQGESLSANAAALSAQEALTQSISQLNTILKTSLALIMGIAAAALVVMTGGAALPAVLAGLGGAGLGFGVQSVLDGEAPSERGPFTITDSYGATAVTAKGDGVVVSPNISQGGGEGITKAQANEMISLLKQVAAKDFSINMDGRKLSNAMQTSGVSYNS